MHDNDTLHDAAKRDNIPSDNIFVKKKIDDAAGISTQYDNYLAKKQYILYLLFKKSLYE